MKKLIITSMVLLFAQAANAQYNTVISGLPVYQNHNCNPYCIEAHQGYGTYWSPSPNQNFGVDVSVRGNNGSFNFQFQGKGRKQRCSEEYVEIPQHYHRYEVFREEYVYWNNCRRKITVFDHYKYVLCTDPYCTNSYYTN